MEKGASAVYKNARWAFLAPLPAFIREAVMGWEE